jgi:hypothetical protein
MTAGSLNNVTRTPRLIAFIISKLSSDCIGTMKLVVLAAAAVSRDDNNPAVLVTLLRLSILIL